MVFNLFGKNKKQTEVNVPEVNFAEGARTEYEGARLSYGYTMKEIAEELGITEPVYYLYESGKRVYKSESKREEFLYKIYQACERLQQRQIAVTSDLAKNTYKSDKEFDTVEDAIIDETSFELSYRKITNKVFNEAIAMSRSGKTVVQIAIKLEVDEDKLARMFDKYNIPYKSGNDHEKMLKNVIKADRSYS